MRTSKYIYGLLLLALFATSSDAQVAWPLKKATNNRYLMDQNNVPFQIRGAACWSLSTGPDSAGVKQYLIKRKSQGFNTVLFEMVQHYYTTYAPNNAYNVAPFTDIDDFTTVNENYWKVIDVIFRIADSLDILLLPLPAYFGYPSTEEGWDTEITATGNPGMKTYAQFLGGRYKNYSNVIWMLGGDRDPSEAEMVTLDSVRNGIRDSISTLLFTLDTYPGTSAIEAMQGRTWLWVNQTYNYGPTGFGHPYVWEASVDDYNRASTYPFFLKESYAEEIHNSASWTTTNKQTVRSANWWSILSGSCGALFMSDQEVYFDASYWVGAMDSAGSTGSSYCWTFFSKRNWWTLIPDTAQSVMTAGYESSSTYATTAYASDSTFIAAYLPDDREVTMNTNVLKAGFQYVASWLDPATGDSTYIGRYDRSSGRAFTPSGVHDWVLLLQSDVPPNGELKHSANSLYLVSQDGTPVFLNGFAFWTLLSNTTYSQATRILDSCYTHKINLLHLMAPVSGYFTGGDTTNYRGEKPWTGGQQFYSTPNGEYWEYVDSIVGYAHTKGIYLMLYADYLGSSSTESWQTQTTAASADQMKTWGEWIGGRYKDSSNVLWGIGGDTDPTSWKTKLDSLVAGIKAAGSTQLLTPRDELVTTTDTHWPTSTWVSLGGQYPYWGSSSPIERVHEWSIDMRGRSPVRPAGLQEATYENENDWTPTMLRRQHYYSLLGGSLAFATMGNCPLWHLNEFDSFQCGDDIPWEPELDSIAFQSIREFHGIAIAHRMWYKLIPDSSNAVLTAGYESGSTLAVAAYASDSTTILCYMPDDRQVTINSNVLKTGQQYVAAWIDPATGDSSYIGTYDRSSSRNFTPSGTNDRVLVLDTYGEQATTKKLLRRLY